MWGDQGYCRGGYPPFNYRVWATRTHDSQPHSKTDLNMVYLAQQNTTDSLPVLTEKPGG